MNQSRIQLFVEWLLDNLFDILTILVAGFLVIRYQVHPPAPADIAEIATWILGVLALLAVSGLWERNRRLHRIEKFSEEGRDLAQRYLSKKIHASDFFLFDDHFTVKELASANTIYFVGITLARTSREFLYALGQRLTTGATIRFIILDPESNSVLEQAYLRSVNAPIDFFRDTLKTTETVVDALTKSPNNKGTVEIGYLPYFPSFGLAMVDPDQSHGICFVEVYQHRSTKPHPTFELRASDDQYWFKYFQEQFDRMWESCRVRKLTQTVEEDAKRQSTKG